MTARASRRATIAGSLASLARTIVETHQGESWPSTKWQQDPVGFARTILGVELTPKQKEILEAICFNEKVAVSGGRKVGKDFVVAIAALWFYCSFERAKVRITATTVEQIDDVLFLELKIRIQESGRCVDCKRDDKGGASPCPHSSVITGKVGEVARSGIKSEDFRSITGRTAKNQEAAAGVSGRILYILDEASGIDDAIYTSIIGNIAASGCKVVLISNPTRSRGFFFDAMTSGKGIYLPIYAPSTESPNYLEGREIFPGLASREWVEERKREWGEDDRNYKIHVLGQFVLNEEGCLLAVHDIAAAEALWKTMPVEGGLAIGIDPAGPSGDGDESAFCVKRGKKIIQFYARRGLTAEAHLAECLALVAAHRGDAGVPRIVIDRDGEVGAKVWGVFIGFLEAHENQFELVGVRGGERAHRQPLVYQQVRDEVYASMVDAFKDGLGIPEDVKLEKELSVLRWVPQISGRTKLVHKEDLRAELGRSPDRADALALACWGANQVGNAMVQQQVEDRQKQERTTRLDPVYDWEKSWRHHDRRR